VLVAHEIEGRSEKREKVRFLLQNRNKNVLHREKKGRPRRTLRPITKKRKDEKIWPSVWNRVRAFWEKREKRGLENDGKNNAHGTRKLLENMEGQTSRAGGGGGVKGRTSKNILTLAITKVKKT